MSDARWHRSVTHRGSRITPLLLYSLSGQPACLSRLSKSRWCSAQSEACRQSTRQARDHIKPYSGRFRKLWTHGGEISGEPKGHGRSLRPRSSTPPAWDRITRGERPPCAPGVLCEEPAFRRAFCRGSSLASAGSDRGVPHSPTARLSWE